MQKNNHIIGLAGRKESGKSEIAKICQEFGYERISFATPLKHLIASLIGGTVEDVNRLKKAEHWQKILGAMDLVFISQETNIPLNKVKEVLENITFSNTREMLQIIGTDLIRGYNKNWHVFKTIEYIEHSDNNKFVVDDMRFPNEKTMVDDMGGTSWFIVRPNLSNTSNHESETSLKWQDFDNIIINDKDIEYLKFNWKIFMENGYDDSMRIRTDIIHKITGNKTILEELISSNETFNILDAMFISKYEFSYNAKYLNCETAPFIHTIFNQPYNTHGVEIIINGITHDMVINPLMVEDLKMYINAEDFLKYYS